MDIPRDVINFIISEEVHKNRSMGKRVIKLPSHETVEEVIKSFIKWAEQDGKLKNDRVDISSWKVKR